MVLIFIGLLFLSLFGYLFTYNPLSSSSFSDILSMGLSIQIKDDVGHTILNVGASPSSVLPYNQIPKTVTQAILAANFILNGSKKACAPNLTASQLAAHHCDYVYTDIITKEYVLNNLIQTNISQADRNEDLFFRIKRFLVLNWLKKHFTEEDFFTFFLNYSYYGNGIIGINAAASKMFRRTLSHLSLAQQIYLILLLVKNNTYIYSHSQYESDLTTAKVAEVMEKFGYISHSELAALPAESPKVFTGATPNTPYQIYLNSMVSAALPNTVQANRISVYSTLNHALQNGLASTLSAAITSAHFSSAAGFVVNRGKIIAGSSAYLKDNNITFDTHYPLVSISQLLKPLMYYQLYNQKYYIPSAVLTPDIQNIIMEESLSPNNLNVKYFPVFAENLTDNANTQKSVLRKIASNLVHMEASLLARVNIGMLKEVFNEMHLPGDAIHPSTYGVGLMATLPLNTLVNSYAVLNQNGTYYTPIFMEKVNSQPLKASEAIPTSLNTDSINKVMTYNTREEHIGDTDETYRVVYDYNVAIIFYKDFTIGLSLGKSREDILSNFTQDYYHYLEDLVHSISLSLPTVYKLLENKRQNDAKLAAILKQEKAAHQEEERQQQVLLQQKERSSVLNAFKSLLPEDTVKKHFKNVDNATEQTNGVPPSPANKPPANQVALAPSNAPSSTQTSLPG